MAFQYLRHVGKTSLVFLSPLMSGLCSPFGAQIKHFLLKEVFPQQGPTPASGHAGTISCKDLKDRNLVLVPQEVPTQAPCCKNRLPPSPQTSWVLPTSLTNGPPATAKLVPSQTGPTMPRCLCSVRVRQAKAQMPPVLQSVLVLPSSHR